MRSIVNKETDWTAIPHNDDGGWRKVRILALI